jgi:hypothetical protein
VASVSFLEFVKNVNKIHNIFKIIFSNIISADNIKSKILTVVQTSRYLMLIFRSLKNKIEDEIIGKIIHLTTFTLRGTRKI